jgi:protocatechuate 3,4-dioxygenase alpha subunit
MAALRSPSQTVGPFFHEALRWKDGGRVGGVTGTRAVLLGRLLDGAGAPVADALVETWQAPDAKAAPAADGKPHGIGRVETSREGTFRIETTIPAGVAPHLEVTIFARGLLKGLRTRVYLASEAQARADLALGALAASPRLATLVARPGAGGEWHWDVRLQGEPETVFFAA